MSLKANISRRMPFPGGKTDYDNFLFNAGIVAHITERQQTRFNFSQGVELPDPGKYYGIGSYGAAVNGHLPLVSSVNVGDSPLQGIKVNSPGAGLALHRRQPAHPACRLLLDIRQNHRS